jgi:hypothetical protein
MTQRLASLVLSLCCAAGCTFGSPPGPASVASATGMTYEVLVRDKTGKYRLGNPAESSDVKVYVFSVHVNSLRQFAQDELLAARALLEQRRSVPAECQGRYRVTKIGRLESGGRTISVECGDEQ